MTPAPNKKTVEPHFILRLLFWLLEIATAMLMASWVVYLLLPLVRRLHVSATPEIDYFLGILILIPIAMPLAMVPAIWLCVKIGRFFGQRFSNPARVAAEFGVLVLVLAATVGLMSSGYTSRNMELESSTRTLLSQ